MGPNIAADTDPANEVSMTLTQKPFNCYVCRQCFGRAEHLKRHLMLHTGERRFSCACGVSFSRNDVLARHVKGCRHKTLNSKDCSSIQPAKRRRVKRACDRCARLKAKCDYSSPCGRCNGKNLTCEYRRENNSELRLIYGLEALPAGNGNTSSPEHTFEGPRSEQLMSPERRDSNVDDETPISVGDSNNTPQGEYNTAANEFDPPPLWKDWSDGGFHLTIDELFSQRQLVEQYGDEMINSTIYDFELEGLSWSPAMAPEIGDLFGNPLHNAQSLLSNGSISSPQRMNLVPNCFSIDQIDPVEARCTEIRALLKGTGPRVPDEVSLNCITRENLLLALTLYGQHYQRNLPFLHSASFNLISAPSVLLLAMFCVGACYSKDIVPGNYLFKLAMHVLFNIEYEPHEAEMEEPRLSMIQASICACSVLGASQDEFGSKVVSAYFARTISMGKRARIFDVTDPIDYNGLTESTFDWQWWIDRETRTRLACALFGQDVATCVFQGTAPSISPLDLDIDLPSYSASWEARSAPECLLHLQSEPSQVRYSTAIRELRSSQFENGLHFEASAFGMFALIKGLHCLLWHATHYDMESPLNPPYSSTDSSRTGMPELASRLDEDFSGPFLSALASEAVRLHGSNLMSTVNKALDNWIQTWEARQYRDGDYENRTFALDPVPFYWLAKLFLLLHCGASSIPDNSEYVSLRLKGSDIRGKLQMQAKIFGWLSRLRRRGALDQHGMVESSLAALMEPINGN